MPLNTIVTRCSKTGIDILENMLAYDPDKRPTAQHTLKYSYFKSMKRIKPTATAKTNYKLAETYVTTSPNISSNLLPVQEKLQTVTKLLNNTKEKFGNSKSSSYNTVYPYASKNCKQETKKISDSNQKQKYQIKNFDGFPERSVNNSVRKTPFYLTMELGQMNNNNPINSMIDNHPPAVVNEIFLNRNIPQLCGLKQSLNQESTFQHVNLPNVSFNNDAKQTNNRRYNFHSIRNPPLFENHANNQLIKEINKNDSKHFNMFSKEEFVKPESRYSELNDFEKKLSKNNLTKLSIENQKTNDLDTILR